VDSAAEDGGHHQSHWDTVQPAVVDLTVLIESLRSGQSAAVSRASW